ncbi:MAG: T9SS type A sorting domain-containing protein [Candidatus Poribacteria bacterium]|nr:T9SS type A sorting domain-containing protein [Candidatus Poribacteria bacterium]
MNRLRLCLLVLSISGIFTSTTPFVDALPPDPELYRAIQTARKLVNLKPRYAPSEVEECVTDTLNILAKNWNHLPVSYKREFQGIFLRPGQPGSAYGSVYLPKKFDTPHFRLHYTTIGHHAPPLEDFNPMNGVPDFVDICAEAMERSFHVEVDLMDFKQPFDDFWVAENGGNHKYDVYLFMFPALGFTTADWYNGRVLSTVVTFGPYFAINSRIYDFFGRSEGIRFIETTSAHEFLHGIQFGYNAFMPTWFMEASATWIESKVYDAGRIEDLDDIKDPDEIGETDAYNYYSGQLRRWLRQPDIALDSRIADHEYGSVIWVLYMAERFDVDIVRQFYGNTTDGSFREFGNFVQVFLDHGTTLIEALKTFTVWNYFTDDRDDGQHYFNGHRFPPVAIHLSDVHDAYPVRVDFDSEAMPEPFSSRYVVFEPPAGVVMEEFAVKIDGADIAPADMSPLTAADRTDIQAELDRLNAQGTRGWGAKFIVEKRDGTTEVREAFTYQRSQEAQITFNDFGGEIQKITLIVVNVRPDVEYVVIPGGGFFGGSVSYMSGRPPAGLLSTPTVSQGSNSGVLVQWELEDLTDIREVVIVRKRTTADQPQPFQRAAEVLNAADRDGNGIPDDDINIVGRVEATDTRFEDTTVFQDVDVNSTGFDPQGFRYYYAVVPVDAMGLMGTPSMEENGIIPAFVPPTETAAPPIRTRLMQSYPNPFNPDVWIPYELAEDTPVSIQIYNLAGQVVRTLELGMKPRGQYITKGKAAYWDGRIQTGERAASGVYFYVLKAGNFVAAEKMAILK